MNARGAFPFRTVGLVSIVGLSILAAGWIWSASWLVSPAQTDSRSPVGQATRQASDGRVRRIGYLGTQGPDWPAPLETSRRIVFEEALRKNGFSAGENLIIEYRFAEDDRGRLPALVSELLGAGVEAILLADAASVGPALEATDSIPLVMAISPDPIARQWADSLSRPGRNVTGQSAMMFDLTPKRFQLLADVVAKPQPVAAPRIGVLYWTREGAGEANRREAEETAEELGIDIVLLPVRSPEEIDLAFERAQSEGIDAMFAFGSAALNAFNERVTALALERRIPLSSVTREWVRAGALHAYAPPYSYMFERAAAQMASILNGASPSEIPIEQPTRFDLVWNARTASQLSGKLVVPDTVAAQISEVLQ